MNKLLQNYTVKLNHINNNGSNEDNILNIFPIYVINLKKDIFRRNYIKHLFNKHKINYKLVIVEQFKYTNETSQIINNIEQSKLGCILSHLWCIKNAIYRKYEKFIIFEDDIIFHNNFQYLFKNILNKSNLDEYGLLMLGALDNNLHTHIVNMSETDSIYIPKNNILGAHANLYTLTFAKEFLNYKLDVKPVLEFDYDYDKFMDRYKIGICCPNLVICELSTTNINHNFSPMHPSCFHRYRSFFPKDFTYNDYEYIIIIFIEFIYNSNANYNSFEDMVENFRKKRKDYYIKNITEWLLNSGYTSLDILQICKYIKND
jgi:GR25 family glycosyltransferase involved in LPS biosynthesis